MNNNNNVVIINLATVAVKSYNNADLCLKLHVQDISVSFRTACLVLFWNSHFEIKSQKLFWHKTYLIRHGIILIFFLAMLGQSIERVKIQRVIDKFSAYQGFLCHSFDLFIDTNSF